MPKNRKNNLRVGCICDGPEVPYWQWRCLKELGAEKYVEVGAVYIPDINHTGINKRLAPRLLEFYTTHVNRPPDFRPEDIRHYLEEEKIQKINCCRKNERFCLTSEQKKTLKKEKLDVLLLFSKLPFTNELNSLATRGAWLPSPVEQSHYWGVPPGFWEIYQDQPATAVWLQRMGPNQKKLRISHRETKNESYVNQLNHLVHEAMSLPRLCCRSLRNKEQPGDLSNDSPPPCKQPPELLHLIFFVLRMFKNWFSETWRELFCREDWNIAVIRKSPNEIIETEKLSFEWYDRNPQEEFRADPFGLVDDGDLLVLYEKLDEKKKGYLVSSDFDNGWAENEEVVHKGEVHLSYPYIFQENGQYYCLPEQKANKRVAAYKFHPEESRLGEPQILIDDVAAVDPTIFTYNNYWWLAFTDGVKGPSSWLHLWYTDDIFGTWQPHELNPVKMDVRSARPAGTPFPHQGKLYRPAQDCSETYGGRVVFNEIIELSPEKFKERVAGQLAPDKDGNYSDGLHTISPAGNYTLVDGKKYVLDLYHFFNKCHKLMGI